MSSSSYMASSIPPHELAELHRLMNEEVREVAVFFMDPDGVITVWNRGAEDMKGYTADDAIGSHLSLLYTDQDVQRGWPQHNLREALQHGFYKEETWRKKKDGSLFWARIALTALWDEYGTHKGFSKITVDLTEHKLLENCLKEREETRRVLRAANAGTWTWIPAANEVAVSPDLLAMLGLDDAQPTMCLECWLDLMHPANRDRVAQSFGLKGGAPAFPLALEAQMRQRNGEYRWFSLRAEWYRENDDAPLVLNGVNVDIQELKNTGEQLRQADARKDEFLAMLAHELRNPLAPVRAAAQLLTMVKLDEARLQQTSAILARQVDHMTSLIDDLLDVSRVTRGLVELEKSPLDMRHIVNDAVEQVSPLIESRRIHLALHLSPHGATVLGDIKRLVQVLSNLLNNAAKYTQEGGHIELRTEVSGGKVFVSVIDDGIGMEPGLVGRVFELFAQAERTPDRSSGGLGLGLALVKSLVELHDGSVSCSSEGIGRGSRFTVSLPLLPANAAPAEPLANGPSQQANGDSLRVLVVDDNADAARMLAMLLEACGHQVLVEFEARRALELAAVIAPDVCLIDIGLPEIDGKEVARRLRAQPATADSVLIAVTGYSHESDREDAIAAGFSHYFVKPVDTGKLVSLLAGISG